MRVRMSAPALQSSNQEAAAWRERRRRRLNVDVECAASGKLSQWRRASIQRHAVGSIRIVMPESRYQTERLDVPASWRCAFATVLGCTRPPVFPNESRPMETLNDQLSGSGIRTHERRLPAVSR
jgi:hypothetical protein